MAPIGRAFYRVVAALVVALCNRAKDWHPIEHSLLRRGVVRFPLLFYVPIMRIQEPSETLQNTFGKRIASCTRSGGKLLFVKPGALVTLRNHPSSERSSREFGPTIGL